ncbi:diadenosine tetraphosphate (Ap4A) HIT family hydrolase [Sinobacterium caligoides]|uniref:Diadenosine tetraphosphate (Ap4A) HIT family hydrolase n=1 Tax=Sinobacterium caligoides TaxID=933926 RepID=A0A3N2D5G9_9GAMM|nr:HIT domain-containing protein [Sinobacterium caligoides]ROR94734.1 diadenosine tetraphosphate (Ap4A) HIT family hydrolase [Sinobacterium caligoides]
MEQKPFQLAAELARDCIHLGDFPLCRVLMMNDAHYPWFILVPRRNGIREAFELDESDQLLLHKESIAFSAWLSSTFGADKINVAALGNMVPQLHLHHIARFKNDAAWPGPVWGAKPAQPFTREDAEGLAGKLSLLARLPGFVAI